LGSLITCFKILRRDCSELFLNTSPSILFLTSSLFEAISETITGVFLAKDSNITSGATSLLEDKIKK